MANSEETFLRLFLVEEANLKAFLRTLVRNPADFDDICQLVALTLWKKFDTYDAQRPFGPWARGVAMREVLSERRNQARRPTPFSPDVVAAIADAFEERVAKGATRNERLEALEHCLEALSEESREMVELRYRRSLSMKQVAKMIGRSAMATQRAISRLRVQLGDCITRRLLASSGE